MVLGLVSLAATVPLTATSVLSLQDQAQQRTGQDSGAAWMRNKAQIRARASRRTPEDQKPIFNDSCVVLRGGFLYVQTASPSPQKIHPFTGYYLPYPDADYDGIASTISDDPPQLNWIYIDTSTHQVRHGLRAEAEQGLTGPWGARVEPREKRVLWGGFEGFLAVETDESGLWACT